VLLFASDYDRSLQRHRRAERAPPLRARPQTRKRRQAVLKGQPTGVL